ncbi:MAG: hypothetical protein MSH32_12385 [Lachnospiraceae bacterium]|nr:hypothetical protein [Lachnospiraceae bacterium]
MQENAVYLFWRKHSTIRRSPGVASPGDSGPKSKALWDSIMGMPGYAGW